MRGLPEAHIVEHHTAITDPSKVAGLLSAIECYSGRRLSQLALKLSPLLFVRPGELRKAERAHFDLEAASGASGRQSLENHRHSHRPATYAVPRCVGLR